MSGSLFALIHEITASLKLSENDRQLCAPQQKSDLDRGDEDPDTVTSVGNHSALPV
jgi:hypothetical protein